MRKLTQLLIIAVCLGMGLAFMGCDDGVPVFLECGEDVGPGLNKFNPFGFVTQGDAGLLEEVGFFLESTAIDND